MSNPNKNSMSNHPPDASYEQLKTILDRVQGFHRRFRKGLADSNSLEDSPGRKHVLNWLQETEEREIELLNRVQSEQNTELLDTWIQYVPDSDCIQKLEDLELRPGMSLDEVHESTMRFYQSLSAFYTQLAQQVTAESANEFLSQLVECYESILRTQAWMMRDSHTTDSR